MFKFTLSQNVTGEVSLLRFYCVISFFLYKCHHCFRGIDTPLLRYEKSRGLSNRGYKTAAYRSKSRTAPLDCFKMNHWKILALVFLLYLQNFVSTVKGKVVHYNLTNLM